MSREEYEWSVEADMVTGPAHPRIAWDPIKAAEAAPLRRRDGIEVDGDSWLITAEVAADLFCIYGIEDVVAANPDTKRFHVQHGQEAGSTIGLLFERAGDRWRHKVVF